MKQRVKPYQYVLMIICFVHGSKLLLSFMDNTARQDSWLITISGFVLSVPFVLSYAYLSKRFAGRDLIEINEAVYGRVLGTAISALYIFFILYLVSLNLRIFSDFYVVNILPEIPAIELIIVFMVCCTAFAVRYGIDAIAKISVVITVLNPILWPLAAVTIVYAIVVHQYTVSHTFIASRYHVILALPFEFILPPLTLLAAVLRKLPKAGKNGGTAEQNHKHQKSLSIAGQPENG